MANHKKTETAAKLKKFYSTMTNAIRLAEIEQGIPVYDWETEYYCDEPEATKAFIERNYLKYLNYTSIGYISDNTDYYNSLGFELQDMSYPDAVVYLQDGTFFWAANIYSQYLYDTNGEKGPNQLGRDIFAFGILESKHNNSPHFYVGSSYEQNSDRNELIRLCKEDGFNCSELVQFDGWEFKDDYPLKL